VPLPAAGGCTWMAGDLRPRCPCPASGLRSCLRWTAAVRSAPPAARPAAPRILPRCPVRWTPAGVVGQVGAAGGYRWSGRSDSGRGWWTPAAAGARRCGHSRRRQRRAAPTATPRWTAGSSTATPMSDQERDRKVRHRPAPPWPDRQIRSLRAAGQLASSWSTSAGQESRPFRYTRVEQGRSLTASLTEQTKLSGRAHQMEIWCSTAWMAKPPRDLRSSPLWVTKPSALILPLGRPTCRAAREPPPPGTRRCECSRSSLPDRA
jgi:hypothetical protein